MSEWKVIKLERYALGLRCAAVASQNLDPRSSFGVPMTCFLQFSQRPGPYNNVGEAYHTVDELSVRLYEL